MIKRKIKMNIDNDEANFEGKIVLYKNDGDVSLHIEMVNLDYSFGNKKGLRSSYIDAVILKPNKEAILLENLKVMNENTIVMEIDNEMINEDTEVGEYLVQFRIYDSPKKENRVSLPIVTFEIKK
jgi:hypothetical protein